MKRNQYILIMVMFVVLFIHVGLLSDEIDRSKQHHERFDALVRDSVKMHKIYENWEINYSELKKLEE